MLNQPKVCIINETNIQGYFCPNGLYLHIPMIMIIHMIFRNITIY